MDERKGTIIGKARDFFSLLKVCNITNYTVFHSGALDMCYKAQHNEALIARAYHNKT